MDWSCPLRRQVFDIFLVHITQEAFLFTEDEQCLIICSPFHYMGPLWEHAQTNTTMWHIYLDHQIDLEEELERTRDLDALSNHDWEHGEYGYSDSE